MARRQRRAIWTRSKPTDSAARPEITPISPRSATSPGRFPDTRLFPAEAKIPMPDPSLQNQVGPPGVFQDVGLTTMGRLNLAGLRPDHDVLDVGCGVGRTARYLCDYLDKESRYEGFDIMEQLIEWCKAHITPLFPNFQFQFVPVYNSAYLPDASLQSASELRFPYSDESFDFALAHSVFTHMSLEASVNYLHQIHRILRPGGISYSTWFLFENDPSTNVSPLIAGMQLDATGDVAFDIPEVPDAAVGYRESFVRKAYAETGLTIVEPIHPGFAKLQDAVVALK
jgi:SAM-dependent methyltransferase